MKKTILTRLALLLMAGAVFAQPALAEPGKEETFNFIKKKITQTFDWSFEYTDGAWCKGKHKVSTSFNAKKCVLIIIARESTKACGDGKARGNIELMHSAIPLAYIDPSKIEINTSVNTSSMSSYGIDNVTMYTRDGEDKISYKAHVVKPELGRDVKTPGFTSVVEIPVKDNETALRVSKALSHLSKLCGAKGELF